MRHALQIQEIVFNIFGHCLFSDNSDERRLTDLLSLARTCRTFKEPALDLLWEELDDLVPLARCLSEASCRLDSGEYTFVRTLTQKEWDILRSYTRRIRFIRDFKWGIDHDHGSLGIILDTPTAEPLLFPNLRHLHCRYRTRSTHLLHLPFPSLIDLDVDFHNPSWFRDSLKSFAKFSPNLRRLSVCVGQPDTLFNKLFSDCICQWKNLRTVICPEIPLDTVALAHLTCVSTLNQLDFVLGTTLPANSLLVFSDLHDLSLRSKLLDSTSQFLSQTRLPVIMNFNAIIDKTPSRQQLISFWATFQTSSTGHTIKAFSFDQSSPIPSEAIRSETLLLRFEDLQPCMTIHNLRYLQFNIERTVSLTDSELLTLASAWPHLEHLLINPDSGWHTQDGITPNGLFQLMQRCRSLRWVTLALDTRSYTAPPVSGLLESVGYMFPSFWLDVVDSIIETESIPVIASFFAPTPCSSITIRAWLGGMVKPPGWKAYAARWEDVRRRANVGAG